MFQCLMKGKLDTNDDETPPNTMNATITQTPILSVPRYPVAKTPTKSSSLPPRQKVKTELPFPLWGRAHAKIQRQMPIAMTKEELRKYGSDAPRQYTSIYGKIYDITEFRKYHPGGDEILAKYSDGRECGAMFAKYHQWVNVDSLLGNAFIGHLKG